VGRPSVQFNHSRIQFFSSPAWEKNPKPLC
jgi:hypothetical protein